MDIPVPRRPCNMMDQSPLMALMRDPTDDLLSFLLGAYQLRAGVMTTPSLCAAWQFGTSGMRQATFHYVASGPCWLHTRHAPPLALDAGALVMFPHDAWHLLAPKPELDGEDLRPTMEGDGPVTTLLCGYFEFLAGRFNPVIEALPDVIVVPAVDAGGNLGMVVRVLMDEARTDGIGTSSVLNKLADTLFVMGVRHHLRHCDNPKGLLAGLADPGLRRALNAIHRRASENWTLELLAREAGMSRTTFAQRFAEHVGSTPSEYLTRWRMTQAELILRDPGMSVAHAAGQVGYDDESAFRKAFKRVHGQAPGALRRWFRSKLQG